MNKSIYSNHKCVFGISETDSTSLADNMSNATEESDVESTKSTIAIINSVCYCGSTLVVSSQPEKTDWRCRCCFTSISKTIIPYTCNQNTSCIFRKLSVTYRYKSCSDCVTNATSGGNDHTSILYQKFKASLAEIS